MNPTHTLPDRSSAFSDDHAIITESLRAPERFGAIFDRHHDAVSRYARSRVGPLAEDVVADTFVEAFRSRERFDRARAATCLPWLLGIATTMIDRRRASERRWVRKARIAPAPPDDELRDVDERLASEQLAPWLAAALASLRRRDRTTLLLHVAGDLSIDEIADALRVPPGTVKSRLNRARRILAAHLEVHR